MYITLFANYFQFDSLPLNITIKCVLKDLDLDDYFIYDV